MSHLLGKHNIVTYGKTPLNCTYADCQFRTYGKQRMKDHVDSKHLKITKFSCEICGKLFCHKGSVKQHVDFTHNKLKRAKCDICGKEFQAQRDVDEHKNLRHRDGRPPEHICQLCGKAFVVQSYLDIHIRGVHNKVEDLACPECPPSSNQKLYSKKSLKRHMDAVHKKQQSCPLCGTGFVTEYDVTSHFRMVHMKYRQYRCKVCGARYGKSSSLKKHIYDKHYENTDGNCISNPSKICKTHPAYEDLKCTPGSDFPSDKEVLRQMELEVERALLQ